MVTTNSGELARTQAEAAAWLARLQSDERTRETEAAFQTWLRLDARHEAAFERATEVWEVLPGAAAIRQFDKVSVRPAANTNRNRSGGYAFAALAATLVAGLAVGGYFFLSKPEIYSTGVGEQQVKTLADGSRISLNTNSEVQVAYRGGVRHIELERGEAVFDVEHDPSRPFLVDANGERVRAIGTSFVVRRDENRVTVTLLRGKVDVSRLSSGPWRDRVAIVQTQLVPGERATMAAGAAPTVDRASVDAVTAWRRGEVVFTNSTLLDAANEMNRYSSVKISIADPAAQNLRVSGIFETNDPAEFASVMATMNGLHATRRGQGIELSR